MQRRTEEEVPWDWQAHQGFSERKRWHGTTPCCNKPDSLEAISDYYTELEEETSFANEEEQPAEVVVGAKAGRDGILKDGHFFDSGIINGTTTSQRSRRRSAFAQLWNEFWFPPHVPKSCQLFRQENVAIPACYLLVGLLQGLAGPLINVLPLDMGATEAQQVTVAIVTQLPASFKLFFGFLSDTLPIFGYRRKSYMMIGWMVASLAALFLLLSIRNDLKTVTPTSSKCFSSDNNKNQESNDDNNDMADDHEDDGAVSSGSLTPAIRLLALCFFLFGCGSWLADVMADAMVAEKAKLESIESRGSLQSTCYSYRFFGVMCALPMSTFLYTVHGPYHVIVLLSLLPLTILPVVYGLEEHIPVGSLVKSSWEHCLEIWDTVCSRATWQPMGFVFLYNVLQVTNAAGKEFSRTVLHFTSCQLNIMFFAALVLVYLGILCYKYFWIHSSWRTVYMVTTIVGVICSALQLMLIYGKTLGLPPFWFAMGDHAFSEFVEGVQFLPITIMMVHLCPAGSEVRMVFTWNGIFGSCRLGVLYLILTRTAHSHNSCPFLSREGCKLRLVYLSS